MAENEQAIVYEVSGFSQTFYYVMMWDTGSPLRPAVSRGAFGPVQLRPRAYPCSVAADPDNFTPQMSNSNSKPVIGVVILARYDCFYSYPVSQR